eukprot:Gb_09595 [translate_table: standard]
MGKCMASGCMTVSAEIGDQFIRIAPADEKVLEYNPISANDFLLGHEGHTVARPGALRRSIRPNYKLIPGDLYSLLTLESASKWHKHRSKEHKDLKATSLKLERNEAVSSGNKNGVIRLRVVITKQELAKLLSDSLAMGTSMEDVLVELKAKGAQTKVDSSTAPSRVSNFGWRPALESIPEESDAFYSWYWR